MIKDIIVTIQKHPSPIAEYSLLYDLLAQTGDFIGKKKHGDKWECQLYPSEEKLRIILPPTLQEGKNLTLHVLPYHWSELQKQRQLQPIGAYPDQDPLKYALNAVALTANALIETDDHYLLFHKKKGGAKQGSIHTFGGYVTSEDLEKGGIAQTLTRELSEHSELGLHPKELEVSTLFGTPEGMPSILWAFGTGAIYGIVKTKLTAREIEERLQTITAEETLDGKIYKIPISDAASLKTYENIHPQTKQTLDTIIALYAAQ